MKLLRNIGLYLGHLLTALIGTAILTTGFGMLYRPSTVGASILKVWILDILSAGVLGFLAFIVSRSKLGVWVWIPAAAWFALGIATLIPTIHGQTVLSPNRGYWYAISGLACTEGIKAAECRHFFAYTLPLIRCVGYSIGMFVAVTVRGLSRKVETSSAPGGSLG